MRTPYLHIIGTLAFVSVLACTDDKQASQGPTASAPAEKKVDPTPTPDPNSFQPEVLNPYIKTVKITGSDSDRRARNSWVTSGVLRENKTSFVLANYNGDTTEVSLFKEDGTFLKRTVVPRRISLMSGFENGNLLLQNVHPLIFEVDSVNKDGSLEMISKYKPRASIKEGNFASPAFIKLEDDLVLAADEDGNWHLVSSDGASSVYSGKDNKFNDFEHMVLSNGVLVSAEEAPILPTKEELKKTGLTVFDSTSAFNRKWNSCFFSYSDMVDDLKIPDGYNIVFRSLTKVESGKIILSLSFVQNEPGNGWMDRLLTFANAKDICEKANWPHLNPLQQLDPGDQTISYTNYVPITEVGETIIAESYGKNGQSGHKVLFFDEKTSQLFKSQELDEEAINVKGISQGRIAVATKYSTYVFSSSGDLLGNFAIELVLSPFQFSDGTVLLLGATGRGSIIDSDLKNAQPLELPTEVDDRYQAVLAPRRVFYPFEMDSHTAIVGSSDWKTLYFVSRQGITKTLKLESVLTQMPALTANGSLLLMMEDRASIIAPAYWQAP